MAHILFAHSLFRTGSTYLWNKLRNSGKVCCFYEPLHQDLIAINKDKPKIWDCNEDSSKMMHHPIIKDFHHQEYQSLLHDNVQGVPFFQKRFSFDDFCITDANPDLKRYLDSLIKGSRSKHLFFKFNRSALRTGWFKATYPKAHNLYLVRHPRDQWASYWAVRNESHYDIFFVMDLIIASVNCHHRYFKNLADHVNLFHIIFENYEEEEKFYRAKLAEYTLEDQYMIFYYIWYCALLVNILYADSLININLLNDSQKYRKMVLNFFNNNLNTTLTFDDIGIRTYRSSRLPGIIMDKVEKEVQHLVLSALSNEEENKIRKKVPALDEYTKSLTGDL